MDNVFIERLWRSLKYECVYLHAFETGSELRAVVAPSYSTNANDTVRNILTLKEGEDVAVNLQQVVAADFSSQTRAMIDAAMERTVAGIVADVPPLDRIRASIGLPTRGIWTNRAEKMVNVEPMAATGWQLSDYRDAERLANRDSAGWTVRVIPPAALRLKVNLQSGTPVPDTISPDVAVWALQRWGLAEVRIVLPKQTDGSTLIGALDATAIRHKVDSAITEPKPGFATVEVAALPPAARASSATTSILSEKANY